MKLSRVSAARLASSWVGEVGVEPTVPDTVPELVEPTGQAAATACVVQGSRRDGRVQTESGIRDLVDRRLDG